MDPRASSRRFRRRITLLWILAALLGTAAVHGTFLAIHHRPTSDQQLWHVAALLAACVAVIVIAATSTRREALLARARSDFIAGVSHELRMPLAQILLASETLALEREPDSQAQVRLAQSIVREARRLAALVDNVLLVARTGATTLRPTLTRVPVDRLFADVTESVELAVQDAGLSLDVQAAPGLAVQGDAQLLRQALANLVDNACKYGGGAGNRIRLRAGSFGESVALSVADEGPGIPPALRRLALEAYERLPDDQVSERTGSGLGLAVAAQIARACGGGLRIEAVEPKGTRVVITLPAAP